MGYLPVQLGRANRPIRPGEILIATFTFVVGGPPEPLFHIQDERVISRIAQEPKASDVAPEESRQLVGTAFDGLGGGYDDSRGAPRSIVLAYLLLDKKRVALLGQLLGMRAARDDRVHLAGAEPIEVLRGHAAVREGLVLDPLHLPLRVHPRLAQLRRDEAIRYSARFPKPPDLPAPQLSQTPDALGAEETASGALASPTADDVDISPARALDDRRLHVHGGRNIHAALLHNQREPFALQGPGNEAAALKNILGEPLVAKKAFLLSDLGRSQMTHVVTGVRDEHRLVPCAHVIPLAAVR